jgi:hypothetical protein
MAMLLASEVEAIRESGGRGAEEVYCVPGWMVMGALTRGREYEWRRKYVVQVHGQAVNEARRVRREAAGVQLGLVTEGWTRVRRERAARVDAWLARAVRLEGFAG